MPDDVAVGGFDDSSVATSTHPAADHDPPAAGARSPTETVRLLLGLIDGAKHVEPVILPTELVIRESA